MPMTNHDTMAQDKPRTKRRLFLILGVISLALIGGALWYWHPWQHPVPIVIRERINPRDGAVMVWVPAGNFNMGSSDTATWKDISHAVRKRHWSLLRETVLNRLRGHTTSDESPVHAVYLDGYWIYKYEVTVAQYRQFCRATKRAMPEAPGWGWQDTHPVVNVTWHDAAAYAAWAVATLPTEAQWEKAARGTDGRVYPWGNAWDAGKCVNHTNSGRRRPHPVGSYPAGASPYGVQDMAGNVWEWCADWYDGEYYHNATAPNPTGLAKGTWRVLRSGPWVTDIPDYFRAANRISFIPTYRFYYIGFRCVVCAPGP